MIKSTWHPATEKVANIYNEVREEALRLFPNVIIPEKCYISSRMGKKALGTYFSTAKKVEGEPSYSYIRKFVNDNIVFSKLIYTVSVDEIYNVVVHEIAHCVADKYFKYNCKHNSNWKYVGDKIGEVFNQKVHRFVQDENTLQQMRSLRTATPKRELYCNHCHITYQASKDTYNNAHQHNCGKCHQPLSKDKDFSKPIIEVAVNQVAALDKYLGKTITFCCQHDGGTIVVGKLVGVQRGRYFSSDNSYFVKIIPTRCRLPQTWRLFDISNFVIFEGVAKNVRLYGGRNFEDDWFKDLKEDKDKTNKVIFVNYKN